MSARRYSERAQTRLHIAARLLAKLGLRGLTPERYGEAFFDRVLEVIGALSPQRREELRGYVDWVEAYERAERDQRGPVSVTIQRSGREMSR